MYNREVSLISNFIKDASLDLSGVSILLEIGSGHFIWSPIIAYYAGAKAILCIIRDSKWGAAASIKEQFFSLCVAVGADINAFKIYNQTIEAIEDADIVMSMGFVRPLNSDVLSKTKKDAVVSLLVEPWEVRISDVDIEYMQRNHIPFCGTNEQHESMKIFEYVGLLTIKLLLDKGISTINSNFLVISSRPFLDFVCKYLQACGGNILSMQNDCDNCDAVIVAEQGSVSSVWNILSPNQKNKIVNNKIPIIHISGEIDKEICNILGNQKYPEGYYPPQVMTKTTDYVGPDPVIKLHAGAMKAAEILWREFQITKEPKLSQQKAVNSGWALI
ncbi:MAG: YkuS family protein [Alphaproteobacteria bacterium]